MEIIFPRNQKMCTRFLHTARVHGSQTTLHFWFKTYVGQQNQMKHIGEGSKINVRLLAEVKKQEKGRQQCSIWGREAIVKGHLEKEYSQIRFSLPLP